MQNDSEAILDSLLCQWWQWRPPMQPSRGYERTAQGFEYWRCSRQYDDQNGALYDDEQSVRMSVVDHQVNKLEPMHRIAIHVQARALTLGCTVFNSPRLPQNPKDRDSVIRSARSALTTLLLSAGIL